MVTKQIFFLTLLSSFLSYAWAILGGEPVSKISDYPYTARVIKTQGGAHVCGAVVYSHNRILTTADCVYSYRNKPQDISITVGALATGASGQLKPASKVVVHPEYNPAQRFSSNIALIKLDPGLRFSDDVKACEAMSPFIPDGPVIILGWGADGDYNDGEEHTATTLQSSMRYRTLDHLACGAKFREHPKYRSMELPKGVFCADGGKIQGAACAGDSGGPGGYTHGARTVFGLISSGDICDPEVPVVFTDIMSFEEWLFGAT